MPTMLPIPLSDFDTQLGIYTEVSSVAIGGKVLSVSDEFFAPASDLLLVGPAPSLKGQFGPNGALFSGWESKRHNQSPYDWVIIKLGPPAAVLKGFDIDTSHFTGNHGPAASVEGIYSPETEPTESSEWLPLLPESPLSPSSQHLFLIPPASSPTAVVARPYTHLRLRMYPDGGIARFRAYGIVQPIWLPSTAKPHPWDARPSSSKSVLGGIFGSSGERKEGEIDLAHAFNGGTCVFESDTHYGVGANLLLPGRGVDMGDGWETKRSRTPSHRDFVVIKLGAPGLITGLNIDTFHFKGNYPAGVEVHAINFNEVLQDHDPDGKEQEWTILLSRTKVGPHAEHLFAVEEEGVQGKVFTHVRLTIYPDGGVKRLRVYGTRAVANLSTSDDASSVVSSASTTPSHTSSISHLPLTPLSISSFAPYGTIIQSYPSSSYHLLPYPPITSANNATASKQPRLTVPVSSYPPGSGEVLSLGVFRASPPEGFKRGKSWEGKMWERHPYTSQSFVPMGKGNEELEKGGEGMVVVVALNGEDDKPNMSTAKAFVLSGSQGITYNTGVWHHSLLTYTTTDFACLETQCSPDGTDPKDCEVLRRAEGEESWYVVNV